MALKCNGCWQDLEAKTQCIATTCGHLFCVKCAQSIVENDASCPICEHVVAKSNIKLVTVLQENPACKLTLCGQTPETILHSALHAINFYASQQQLQMELREAQLQKKISKVQEACRKKLEEVHSGYQVAKRKYQEVLQQRNALEQDNQELQQKYSQKALQARKLNEMVKKLEAERDAIPRGSGALAVVRAGQQGQGGQQVSPFGRQGATQLVTTVHRTNAVIDLSPQPQSLGLPGRCSATAGTRPGSASGHYFGNILDVDSPMRLPAAQRPGTAGGNRGGNLFPVQQGNAGLGPQLAGRDQLGAGNALRRLLNGGSGAGAAGGGRPFAALGSPSGMVSL